MDVKEAVKSKENYSSIVAWFQSMETLDMDQMVLLIDTIDSMSEEIYEHYRALQIRFKQAAAQVLERRQKEGNFSFLTKTQKTQFGYALKKAGEKKVLLAEKYQAYIKELETTI